MQWVSIWSGVKSPSVTYQICKLLTDLVKMIRSLSLSVPLKKGMINGEKATRRTSLVPGTLQLPHSCSLGRLAYKERVLSISWVLRLKHNTRVPTSFGPSWEVLPQSLSPCVLLLAGCTASWFWGCRGGLATCQAVRRHPPLGTVSERDTNEISV